MHIDHWPLLSELLKWFIISLSVHGLKKPNSASCVRKSNLFLPCSNTNYVCSSGFPASLDYILWVSRALSLQLKDYKAFLSITKSVMLCNKVHCIYGHKMSFLNFCFGFEIIAKVWNFIKNTNQKLEIDFAPNCEAQCEQV